MAGFQVHTGKAALYLEDHVDTDRIIPARFLSRVERSGYGELLFVDARKQTANFPLDLEATNGASVLIVGTNFGCGSSREHAVWAIQQAGFVVILARKEATSPGYSDIFRQNSANCGLLLVELEPADHARLATIEQGSNVTVDLPNQTVSWEGGSCSFEIGTAIKNQMLLGLDLIGLTLQAESEIKSYEASNHSFSPKQFAGSV